MNIFITTSSIVFALLTVISILLLLLHLLYALKRTGRKINKSSIKEKVSIVIPAHNEELNITDCLNSILLQDQDLIEKIIVVIDSCNDKTEEILDSYMSKHHTIKKVKTLNNFSKPEALRAGLIKSQTKHSVLIDADIVLAQGCLKKLLEYYFRNKYLFSTCLIDPIVDQGIISKLISCDRLFRQRILQMARGNFGLANNPGGFIVVNKDIYLEIIKDSLVEDLVLTYELFERNIEVGLLPEVLAFEKERTNIASFIKQRTRWIIGNIKAYKYFSNAILHSNPFKGLIIFSYPFLWYFIHYIITIGLLLTIFNLYLVPFVLILLTTYFLCVYISIKSFPIKGFNIIHSLLHSVTFSIFVSIASIYTLFLLVKDNKEVNYLNKSTLFSRDYLIHKKNKC